MTSSYNIEIILNEHTPKIPHRTTSVDEFIKENSGKLTAFLGFAKLQPKAVGLAANQVSIDGERFMERVFAIKDGRDKTWRLIIDPNIDSCEGIKELKEEGCLTYPGRVIVAERSRRVQVSYYDTCGELHIGKVYSGFEAQIWQHEMNHLNGVEERIEHGNFMLPRTKEPQRNEPCPCNSGKKYKQCCKL